MERNLFEKNGKRYEVTFNGNSICEVKEIGHISNINDYADWTIEKKLNMKKFAETFL